MRSAAEIWRPTPDHLRFPRPLASTACKHTRSVNVVYTDVHLVSDEGMDPHSRNQIQFTGLYRWIVPAPPSRTFRNNFSRSGLSNPLTFFWGSLSGRTNSTRFSP